LAAAGEEDRGGVRTAISNRGLSFWALTVYPRPGKRGCIPVMERKKESIFATDTHRYTQIIHGVFSGNSTFRPFDWARQFIPI
jgi:hypothetical protein